LFYEPPDFAVGILDTILQNNYNVVGVITAADKPAGRGQK
jgi:methionyl-tRNA formyltransferase